MVDGHLAMVHVLVMGQEVPLRWALQQSNNWISAYLINLLGPSQFVNILHDFGLNNPDIDKNTSPVLCLGPCEASVGEMASAIQLLLMVVFVVLRSL